mgnify:CR=1 FL=1
MSVCLCLYVSHTHLISSLQHIYNEPASAATRILTFKCLQKTVNYKCDLEFGFRLVNIYILPKDLQNGLSGEVDLTWRFYTHINGC